MNGKQRVIGIFQAAVVRYWAMNATTGGEPTCETGLFVDDGVWQSEDANSRFVERFDEEGTMENCRSAQLHVYFVQAWQAENAFMFQHVKHCTVDLQQHRIDCSKVCEMRMQTALGSLSFLPSSFPCLPYPSPFPPLFGPVWHTVIW